MRIHKTVLITSAIVMMGAGAPTMAQTTAGAAYLQAQGYKPTLLVQADFDPAVAAKTAERMIADMGERAISTLEAEADDARRAEVFDKLLNEKFDMEKIARFSLGRYWAVATPDQQRTYTKLFKDMVVDVYSNRFEDYSGQKFEVKGSKPVGRNDVLVNSMILSPNGQPPVKVDWRLRDNKIIDVIVEGVSMSVTQRSEFNSIIQRNGGQVAALIDHLKK